MNPKYILIFVLLVAIVISGCIGQQSTKLIESAQDIKPNENELPAEWKVFSQSDWNPPSTGFIFDLEKPSEKLGASMIVVIQESNRIAQKDYFGNPLDIKINDARCAISKRGPLVKSVVITGEGQATELKVLEIYSFCIKDAVSIVVQVFPSSEDVVFNEQENREYATELTNVILNKVDAVGKK